MRAALIRNDLQRTALIGDKSDETQVRIIPRAPGVDIAFLAEEAGLRGDHYRVGGRISVRPAAHAAFTPEERKANDELSDLGAEAEFKGEHPCPRETKTETTIEGISTETLQAAVTLLLTQAKSEEEKLNILIALKRDGKVPEAARALVDNEIKTVTQTLENGVRLARQLKEDADRKLREAERFAREAVDKLREAEEALRRAADPRNWRL